MEIRFPSTTEAVGKAPSAKPAARDSQTDEKMVTLQNAQALRAALHNTPESRKEQVERALQFVGRVEYPPPETIQKISHLLALHLQSEGQA